MKSLLVSWVIFWTLWSSSNFFLLHSVSADDEGVHTPKPIVIQPIGKHKYTVNELKLISIDFSKTNATVC